MNTRLWLIGAAACALVGCGSPSPPPPAEAPKPESAPSVFDPLVGTIDRAKAVQGTVDEHAGEQRRRIEELER
jgi:hypothetical protein